MKKEIKALVGYKLQKARKAKEEAEIHPDNGGKISIKEYADVWMARLAEDERKRLRLFHKVRESAEKAARILVEDFCADRVYLFGSLLTENSFSEFSELDIVVSGLKIEKYFKALSAIWTLFPKEIRGIDLIPLEDADEYLRHRVLAEGIILYDKK